MSQVLALPKCFALSSKPTGNYIRYVDGKLSELIIGPDQFISTGPGEDEGAYGIIVRSPHTRFFVELSKEHDGLVHVRCGYNNKYWVPKDEASGWTIGTAHEPEEDQSRPSCTLFKPIYAKDADNNLSIRFLYPHLAKSVMLSTGAYLHLGDVHEENDEEIALSTFILLDLSKTIILPAYYAFKGYNGKYLNVSNNKGNQYLKFSSSDIGDPGVENTCKIKPEGLMIWNVQDNDCLWIRKGDDWVIMDISSDVNYDYYFEVVKVNNYYALRNLGNEKFCKSLTKGGQTDCLSVCSSTITKEATFNVEETVLSRDIYDVVFDIDGAKTHNKSVLTMSTICCMNRTEVPNTFKLTLEYTQTESTTWAANVSMKIGVKANIMAGIPYIANTGVEVSAEVSASYSWGKTYENSTKRSMEYEVAVPPNTKVTLSVIATQGSCDVPFSYTQMDILTTGRTITYYDLTDGIYYGINTYDVKYETKQESIE